MNILVTGGARFIGSNVVGALVEKRISFCSSIFFRRRIKKDD